MINLEKLVLFVSVLIVDSNYTDAIHFYDEMFINMPRLNKFTFSIVTQVVIKNLKIDFPSNEDINKLVRMRILIQLPMLLDVMFIHFHFYLLI